MLKSTGLRMEPCTTPLETGDQPDLVTSLLTVTLGVQLLTHRMTGWTLGGTFLPVAREFKPDCFVVTVARMATNGHVSHKSLSVNKQQITEGTLPGQLPPYLRLALLIQALQGPVRTSCRVFHLTHPVKALSSNPVDKYKWNWEEFHFISQYFTFYFIIRKNYVCKEVLNCIQLSEVEAF
ncbi:hypothetical protein HGM15179_016655 [Zosterops borbonicus]|uniref:Uncharacterized protein n=1 Tax=Zosterops borbonicus TaxID=364589 RepID=A0A8K1G2E2_9PASS|nr:hypothetical protein HGM15179_016655 [Zosterops borbonicus]